MGLANIIGLQALSLTFLLPLLFFSLSLFFGNKRQSLSTFLPQNNTKFETLAYWLFKLLSLPRPKKKKLLSLPTGSHCNQSAVITCLFPLSVKTEECGGCSFIPMAEEKDAFYVVKKGGVVGIYKSLKDIQPLIASSSVSDDPVSILKGYCLTKKAEEFLVSNGLKGAPYSISATNLNEELFGRLVACPYQDPCASGGRSLGVSSSSKLLQGAFQSDTSNFSGFSLHSTNSQRQVPLGGSSFGITSYQRQLTPEVSPLVSTNSQRQLSLGGSQAQLSNSLSCTLEFDGASKGNPGPAGAGAILRAADGSKVYRIREGVGTQTNNVAEYRALLLGLKQALQKGYRHIQIRGDSLLVCKQVNGEWKQKNQNMAMLCAQVNQLKANFLSFQINHVLREKNSEADAQANLAINLRAGQVEEDCEDLRR